MVAILLVCHKVAPDAMDIHSDGGRAEWQEAHEWVESEFDDGFDIPPQVDRNDEAG